MDGYWTSLGLNLVSEFISILATVLVVDRLLRRMEDRRWIPTQQIVIRSVTTSLERLYIKFEDLLILEGMTISSVRRSGGQAIAIRLEKLCSSFEETTSPVLRRWSEDLWQSFGNTLESVIVDIREIKSLHFPSTYPDFVESLLKLEQAGNSLGDTIETLLLTGDSDQTRVASSRIALQGLLIHDIRSLLKAMLALLNEAMQ